MTTATLGAAWMLKLAINSNPQLQARAPTGPGALAIGDFRDTTVAVTSHFDTRWEMAAGSLRGVPLVAEEIRQYAANVPHVPLPPARPHEPKVKHEGAAVMQVASLPRASVSASGAAVPLPPRRPLERAQVASLPAPGETKPQEAAKPSSPKIAPNKAFSLPGVDDKTAVYDISARTVYLPNGQKLEAHSGLGEKMDNPRYVHVRMRGSTPPNVYELTLREKLFHGVQAIRLNPVDEDKMYGRDGILAHTYMLGSNGQSNGCVSFKDYEKFLSAYLRGDVTRMVVVPSLAGDVPVVARKRDEKAGWRWASNY
jgi:type VI secretion system (T6SS) effector TldE1-like protein